MVESFGLVQTSSPQDGLIAGDYPLKTKAVTIQSGQGLVARGTILGKITKEVGTVVPGGSNVGDGDVSNVALKSKSKLGNYVLTCKTAAVGGGTFEVKDPDGGLLADAEVGVAYSNNNIGFLISAGSADFAVGDTFSIPIEAPSSEEWVKSLAAAVDGSQEIDCILTEAVDATSAAVLKSGYISGDFDENKLVFGTGHTANSLREAARAKNLYFYNATEFPTY